MISNVRKIIILLFFSSIFHVYAEDPVATVWDSSPIGSCEKSKAVDADESINTDENPVAKIYAGKNSDGEQFYWYWDSTPSRNVTRTLVREGKDGGACVVLFLPFSDSYEFKIGKNGEMPLVVKSFTSPQNQSSGEEDAVVVFYKFNKTTKLYGRYPISCKKKNKNHLFSIDCKEAFK